MNEEMDENSWKFIDHPLLLRYEIFELASYFQPHKCINCALCSNRIHFCVDH